MDLRLKVEGALPEELRRGIDAAWAVFRTHGVNPVDAADGYFAMEQWDDAGFADDGDAAMSNEEARAADVWLEAGEAAIKACCATWTEPAPAFTDSLEIILTEAEKLEHGR